MLKNDYIENSLKITIQSAANGVLAFKPKKVYLYHYRVTKGLSDVERFKTIVNEKNTILKKFNEIGAQTENNY